MQERRTDAVNLRQELGRSVRLPTETARFALLSLVDLLLTYLLLLQTHVRFVEANPVARFFINHWGPKGMVWFKAGMVALVITAAQIVAWKRPETAKWLLNFATLAVTLVVLYSAVLLARHGWIL